MFDFGSCSDGMGVDVSFSLSNNHMVSVSLDSKRTDPLYADFLYGRKKPTEETDGNRAYFGNGASLSLDEMIDMIMADSNGAIKISKVEMYDGYRNANGKRIETILLITVNNEHEIWLNLDSKANIPIFNDIIEENTYAKPKTDGSRVFWDNGASLDIKEIIDMIKTG
jgi:hypothetical protein